MRYVSTRGQAPVLAFADAVLAGLARDGGLYLPETWPQLAPETIAGFAGKPYHEVAAGVIAPFAAGSIGPDIIARLTRDAYADFGHPAVAPLVQIAPGQFILELFHGPTLAFKDVAMQLLARLMDHILESRGERATIAGATSGDTGGAAIEAFRGSSRVDAFILFPHGRVSDVQRRMMTSPAEGNIHAIAIDGDFDDCQALVKAMFNHHAFRDRVRLAGVNSINWARILAQSVYYFTAAVALGAPRRKVSFCVPTGNFGDIFAGYAAKQMGLPVEKLIIATNANDILRRALETGVYETRGVSATMSPSMDIQVSSNFERLLFEALGRDAPRSAALMASLAQSGRFEIPAAALARIRAEFSAFSASEAAAASAIRDCLAASGYLADPHTAAGLHAACQAAENGTAPMVTLATAHPAKFPDAMQTVTGTRPALPARLAALMGAPERSARLPNDLAAVEAFIERAARAIHGQAA